jgi:DNA-binding NarL/FixJ family response regulator
VKRTTILVADDHTIVCDAITKMLAPDYEIVGLAGDGRALIRTALKLKPDVVLADLGMPLLNGLDAARELKKMMPGIKIIIMTMNPDSDIAREALQIGVSGYVLKTSGAGELLKAVSNVAHGIPYIGSQIRRAMEENLERDPAFVNRRPRQLSERQREVLQLLAEGRPMKEIASILNISLRTVRFHKYKVMSDLGIKTNAELVQYAIKHSVISSP